MLLTGCGGGASDNSGSTSAANDGDKKVLTFGCQMYTDGIVNTVTDENGGWNAMRYGITEGLFKFNDSMEVEPWLADSYTVNDEHTEWVITLKDGKDLPARPAQGIITCTPLGYSDSVEFYQPTYDTPEKKNDQRSDLRSTIYWNPSLQLNADGKATIEYYTPDSTAPEDIIIEGVDKNGKICRTIQTINKK